MHDAPALLLLAPVAVQRASQECVCVGCQGMLCVAVGKKVEELF
jgi:hypothetical protein